MLNRQDQVDKYQEAVRLAEKLKQKNDAEIGDWIYDPACIILHEYKRYSSWPEDVASGSEEVWEEASAREEEKEKYKKDLKDWWFKNFGGAGDEWLEKWIPWSEDDKSVWDGLKAITAYVLEEKAELPGPLRKWWADVLECKRPQPTTRGRTTVGRDFLLAEMVGTICDEVGIQPTRNKGSSSRSGCDAVAEVTHFGYESIENAWFAYGRDPQLRRSMRG